MIQSILQMLRQDDDETQQLAGLTELNEMLSISTEESLLTFPVESTVPILVRYNAHGRHNIVLSSERSCTPIVCRLRCLTPSTIPT